MGTANCKACMQELEGENNTDNILAELDFEEYHKQPAFAKSAQNQQLENTNAGTFSLQYASQQQAQASPYSKPVKDTTNLRDAEFDDRHIVFNPDGKNFMSQSSIKDLDLLDISEIPQQHPAGQQFYLDNTATSPQ